MENKQLESENLLMNKKEELIWRVIDNVDGYDGIAFNRWYADMCRKGIQVDWYNCR